MTEYGSPHFRLGICLRFAPRMSSFFHKSLGRSSLSSQVEYPSSESRSSRSPICTSRYADPCQKQNKVANRNYYSNEFSLQRILYLPPPVPGALPDHASHFPFHVAVTLKSS